jgi:hypothetical protein
MEDRGLKQKKSEKGPAKKKKQPPVKHHVELDNNKAKPSTKDTKKDLDQSRARRELYACLGDECEEAFDAWGFARRHMLKCSKRSSDDGKPNMHESRKKANDLLQEGKAEDTKYPVPTEEELAIAAHS